MNISSELHIPKANDAHPHLSGLMVSNFPLKHNDGKLHKWGQPRLWWGGSSHLKSLLATTLLAMTTINNQQA